MESKIEPLKILIIDDNENNLYTLECILNQAQGVSVLQAPSGQVGLEILAKQEVHLVIVDIQMPVMNGFEFANTIKEDERFKDIPVIFLTAYFKSEEFATRGYKLGAFDYLTKPIDEHRLLNKIGLYSQLHRQASELKAVNTELSKANQALKDARLKSNKDS
tara:strand:- start:15878 stop:16363 length:486 start_codon:yes stop_codon:yes gene_type:complete